MNSKLFVGGIPYKMGNEDLEELFKEFGKVLSAVVIMDREMNRSKGFGFVEFATKEETDAAIKALDGQEVEGRRIVVNEARPQEKRPPRNNGDGGGFNRY